MKAAIAMHAVLLLLQLRCINALSTLAWNDDIARNSCALVDDNKLLEKNGDDSLHPFAIVLMQTLSNTNFPRFLSLSPLASMSISGSNLDTVFASHTIVRDRTKNKCIFLTCRSTRGPYKTEQIETTTTLKTIDKT